MRFASCSIACIALTACLSACAGEEQRPELAAWSALDCDSGEMAGAFGVDDPTELPDCVRARMDLARTDEAAGSTPKLIADLDAAEACLADVAGTRELGDCLYESGAISGSPVE